MQGRQIEQKVRHRPKHAEIGPESFGIVVCRFVGTVPDILGLVWPSFRPKSGSKSKISGRILKRALLILSSGRAPEWSPTPPRKKIKLRPAPGGPGEAPGGPPSPPGPPKTTKNHKQSKKHIQNFALFRGPFSSAEYCSVPAPVSARRVPPHGIRYWCQLVTLCYAIVLPGRKSGFRAGSTIA